MPGRWDCRLPYGRLFGGRSHAGRNRFASPPVRRVST